MRSTPLALALIVATMVLAIPEAHAAPSKLVLTNEFGEKHFNIVGGSGVPLPGSANVILMTGATTPVNGGSGTGANLAAKGSFYIAQDSGTLYQNTNTLASPTWTAASGANLSALQNGTFTPQTETVSAAGAISITKMETTVSNAGGSTFAATLAAPSSQDGQIKIIVMGTATHTVTVACTNVKFSGAYTPTGTTTLTFTNAGDSAVFIAVGTKWVYLGGTAVAS